MIERDAQPLAEVPQQAPAEVGAVALMRMIERAALDPNFDVAKLDKLLTIKERWDAEEARKAFTRAMAEFKKNPPQIVKDTHVKWTKDGKTVEYDHASLGAVCAAVIEGLAQVGISHSWIPEQREGLVHVTCVLTHEFGHSTSTPLFCAPDNSGSKNAIQAVASATTYLSRYTLLMAVGLATHEDDDGRGTGAPGGGTQGADQGSGSTGPKYISETQVLDLKAKIQEVGANQDAFLKVLKVDSLEKVQTNQYAGAIQRLNDKARGVR